MAAARADRPPASSLRRHQRPAGTRAGPPARSKPSVRRQLRSHLRASAYSNGVAVAKSAATIPAFTAAAGMRRSVRAVPKACRGDLVLAIPGGTPRQPWPLSSAVYRALLLRASGWRLGSLGLDASIGPVAGARQIRRAGDGAGLLLLASAIPRARQRAVPGRAISALTAAAAVRGHALPCARSFAAAHLIGEERRRAPLAVVAGRRSATRAVELRRAAPVEDAAASAASQHRLTSLLSGRHTHRTRCREPYGAT